MKIIKVIYNNKTLNILDIVNSLKGNNILETYNVDVFKENKKAIPIQARFGSRNVPLIVFADENLEEYGAIWVETSPNWKEQITKYLNM